MNQKSRDVLLRSDRVLVGALAIILAAASASLGAAAAYRPHTDQARTQVVVTSPAQQAAQHARVEAAAAQSDLEIPAAVQEASEKLVMNKLMAEHRCLSEVMYYEARGEGLAGQKAVAEVVFHRMRTGNYGQSICAVVYEGANKPGCQFSFACNGDLAHRKVAKSWMRAQILAARILTGEERMNDQTGGATSFHAVSVQPDWANELERTVQIGNHVFYKHPPRSRSM